MGIRGDDAGTGVGSTRRGRNRGLWWWGPGALVLLLAPALVWLARPGHDAEPDAWTPPSLPDTAAGPWRAQPVRAEVLVPELPAAEGLSVTAGGELLAGLADGRVVRVGLPTATGEAARVTVVGDTGGRPLGVAEGPPGFGGVVVADARKGLLWLRPGAPGRPPVRLAETATPGGRFGFTDDVAASRRTARVYFTDASTRHGYGFDVPDIIENHPSGRLLEYDFASGRTRVLLTGLSFANGVALARDEAFLLVNETARYRVWRYWLAGPRAGTAEVWADGLPGFPDNVRTDDRGHVWVALYGPRVAAMDALAPGPLWLRRLVMRLPAGLRPQPPVETAFAEWTPDGRLLGFARDAGAGAFGPVTTAVAAGPYVYLGSLRAGGIGRVAWPPAGAKG